MAIIHSEVANIISVEESILILISLALIIIHTGGIKCFSITSHIKLGESKD
jgi:hypothetical protein